MSVIPEHIQNYRYYSDSPGHLLTGDEWELLNAKHVPSENDKLPDGWPEQLEGPLVWSGSDLEKTPEKYLYILSEEDKEELDVAIKSFDQSGQELDKVVSETFPLPKLGPRLESFANDIYNGIGLKLVRGLDVDKYTERQRVIAYLGISSYVGDIRDAQGINRALIHIKSIAHVPKEKRAPIVVSQQTTDAQMFHNDVGLDIVSLFVLDLPKTGGESLITSSYTIYNELAKTRPELISLLADEDEFDWPTKPKEGGSLIHYVDNKYISYFSTRVFIGFGDLPRDERFPPLNDKQKDAFGAFHWVGYKHSLSIPIEKGDIEYVNNLYLQHSRHGFVEDKDHRRHVARLWLRNSKYSSQLKYPKAIQDKIDEGYFPTTYTQEIPLNEDDEEKIKFKYNATSLKSLYAKPK
ncbi:hypothetical protein CAAN1_09S00914 [[Candida] anglica]|uniref:TauD/TfdA-like domain-containing protein n=1 Tax=[Candida] anglica TaxID=148631 RepID=A0ABP0EE79_9ASCO